MTKRLARKKKVVDEHLVTMVAECECGSRRALPHRMEHEDPLEELYGIRAYRCLECHGFTIESLSFQYKGIHYIVTQENYETVKRL